MTNRELDKAIREAHAIYVWTGAFNRYVRISKKEMARQEVMRREDSTLNPDHAVPFNVMVDRGATSGARVLVFIEDKI